MTHTEIYTTIAVVIITIVATLVFYNPRKKEKEQIIADGFNEEQKKYFSKRPTEESWRAWWEAEIRNNKN